MEKITHHDIPRQISGTKPEASNAKFDKIPQNGAVVPQVLKTSLVKVSLPSPVTSHSSEEKLDETLQRSSIPRQDSGVIEDAMVKEKAYQTYAPPELETKSAETIPEVLQLPEQLEQSRRLEEHPQKSRQSPESPEQSQQTDQKQLPKEKKASIVFKDNLPVDMDDEDKKRQYTKRPSGVSWRALSTPSDSDSTASLDQVVKDATAKAETFRQNLDAKRQHSLLDIVKKRSTLEKTVDDVPKPPSTVPPKRKKFFNFNCLNRKKEREKEEKEKEKAEHHSDS